jgi:hypothetical protein
MLNEGYLPANVACNSGPADESHFELQRSFNLIVYGVLYIFLDISI